MAEPESEIENKVQKEIIIGKKAPVIIFLYHRRYLVAFICKSAAKVFGRESTQSTLLFAIRAVGGAGCSLLL